MPVDTASLTGFVLAGGASSRMGEDKAMLRLGERTLLERALDVLAQAAASTVVVGPAAKYEQFGKTVEDVFAGKGPLAGIHAALSHTRTELNIVLSVDTPLVSAKLLKLITTRARSTSALAVVPEMHGRLHPLVGVYSFRLVSLVERALHEENLSATRLVADIADVVTERELLEAGISASEFVNINTPEDLQGLLSYTSS